jgi:23S rRNA (pseudouridine1915-N3)-methyltransferase
MRMDILGLGRVPPGPARTLAEDYAVRATRAGRALGLGPLAVREIDVRAGREAAALAAAAQGSRLVALDQSGKGLSSEALAAQLARLRDEGFARLAFAVGGADGLPRETLVAAADCWSLGPQTWPHALARAMLAEQIYRACAILAGAPYHRG